MILEFIKLNKKKLLIVLIIVIVLSIFSFFINKNEKNKIYMSDSYVYTKDSFEHEEGFVSNLPSINVKGDNVSNINSELILQLFNQSGPNNFGIKSLYRQKHDSKIGCRRRVNVFGVNIARKTADAFAQHLGS